MLRRRLPQLPPEALLDRALANLEQLQAQVDRLSRTSVRQRARIERLTAERNRLREQVEHLRQRLHRRSLLRWRPGGRRARSSGGPAGPDGIDPDATGSETTSPGDPDGEAVPAEGRGLIGLDLPPLPPPHPARPDLVVAGIMDDFSRTCFEYEFDYVATSASDWREVLTDRPPDLLFVESAFGGNRGGWTRGVAGFGDPRPDLVELVEWCRRRGIPTVFWNKEDPINFEWFVASASLFDWVFTVDADTIPWYRAALGHSRIDVLPFAAQPAIHRPPDRPGDRGQGVAFAGSYYAAKHPERRVQMDAIVAPALELGLHIYNRMDPGDARFAWPERYRSAIVGGLPYPGVIEVYRRYRTVLNVNTIVDSPTMCSRRIFELAACGTPVVSSPSRAIETIVPPGVVEVSRDAAETRERLAARLRGDPENTAGPAWIAGGHTYGHRVEQILDRVDSPPS